MDEVGLLHVARMELIPPRLGTGDAALGWGRHQALDGLEIVVLLIVAQSVPV